MVGALGSEAFKQLVGGTELEDSQKQRFHVSRSFSSDTCQGNRQNVLATGQTRVRRTSSTCLITNSLPPKSSFCPTVSISAYHPPP